MKLTTNSAQRKYSADLDNRVRLTMVVFACLYCIAPGTIEHILTSVGYLTASLPFDIMF